MPTCGTSGYLKTYANLKCYGEAGPLLITGKNIIRPQTKRAREHKQLVASLNKGNEVTINGGLMGKISQVNETSLVLEIASGVEVKVQKNSVTNVLPKGTLKSTA